MHATTDKSVVDDGATEAKGRSALPLGKHSAKGFVFTVGQTLVSKALGLFGQYLIARLLFPSDFGAFGLALTVTVCLSVLQDAGIREILLQRQAQLARWQNTAFWLSLMMGLLCAVATAVLAPFCAKFYHAPSLRGLLYVLAFVPAATAVGVVPRAVLGSQLRFHALSTISLIESLATVALTVLLAWRHFGAYALAIPRPIIAVIVSGICWSLAPLKLKSTPQLHRWPVLLRGMGTLLVASLAWTVVTQGDYAILGRVRSASEVGLYFFAYNLAVQVGTVLAFNISNLLLPVLSKLQMEPRRQVDAFLRANTAVTLAGIAVCLAQGLLAPLIIPRIFGWKWAASVPIFQILSIAMAIHVAGYSSRALIKAQGRYGELMTLSIAYAVFFLMAVGFAATLAGPIGVACAVVASFLLFEPLSTYVAIRHCGGGLKQLWHGFFAPLAAGAIGAAVAMLARYPFPTLPARSPWAGLAVTVCVGFAAYVLAARLLCPKSFTELRGQLARRRMLPPTVGMR